MVINCAYKQQTTCSENKDMEFCCKGCLFQTETYTGKDKAKIILTAYERITDVKTARREEKVNRLLSKNTNDLEFLLSLANAIYLVLLGKETDMPSYRYCAVVELAEKLGISVSEKVWKKYEKKKAWLSKSKNLKRIYEKHTENVSGDIERPENT